MSAARVGQWDLLGYDDDPVPAKASGLDEVIKHYKEIADMMHTQAALLKKLGDGDESQLKGNSADAMRSRARKSHDALEKAAGRYDDVHSAIKAYQPELETARSKTGEALADAEDAAARQGKAEEMSDPANEDRGDDAPPLTDKEEQDSRDRASAIDGAKGDLAAAKAKAEAARSALDAAAETAKNKIKENWGDDGLNHSWQEEAYYGFMKFLKGLVEVLGWIGMALAVIAMIIPGLQGIAMAALVVGVVALAGSIVLAATGEESWMGVVFGVLGVLTAGAGMAVAKIIGNATKAVSTAGRSGVAIRMDDLGRLGERLQVFRNNVDGPFGRFARNRVQSGDLQFTEGLASIKALQLAMKVNPAAWRAMSFTSAIGLGGIKQVRAITAALQGLKVAEAPGVVVKPWVYVLGSGSWFAGLVSGAWSTGVPASMFGDDARENYDGTADWEYAHFKTPYHGQLEEVE